MDTASTAYLIATSESGPRLHQKPFDLAILLIVLLWLGMSFAALSRFL